MKTSVLVIIILVFPLFAEKAYAQSSADFQSLTYPMSVSSQGLGEQGVASSNPINAMEYNPADLVYENGLSLSVYRNPWEILSRTFGTSFPLESFAATAKVNDVGNFGLDYTFWDLGEFIYTVSNPDSGTRFHEYQQSFAVGYANSLSNEVAVGGQLRYVRQPIPQNNIDHLLISAGIGYKPNFFDDRLNIGFSLMNFGTRIKTGSYTDTVNGVPVTTLQADPPPATFNLGMEITSVSNNFFNVDIDAAARKPLAKRGGTPDYVGESSFEALFNDWGNFPNDVTGQIGLSYTWHPIYLGDGVSYFQEMYIGYFSTGPKDSYNSFYTHGFNVGIEAYGIKAAVGYAGRWHNNNGGSYATWDFPWETFQFTLSTDEKFFNSGVEDVESKNSDDHIIISGGYGYGVFMGRYKGENFSISSVTIPSIYLTNARGEGEPIKSLETNLPSPALPHVSYSLSPRPLFCICSDFYFNDDVAMTASFAYARINGTATVYGEPDIGTFSADLSMETLTLTSGLRYHPVSFFRPFFIQGDLGIVRRNPIAPSSPAYDYKSLTDVEVGAALQLLDTRIVLIPRVAFRTLFAELSADGSRLGGYNQFLFGLNVGYEF